MEIETYQKIIDYRNRYLFQLLFLTGFIGFFLLALFSLPQSISAEIRSSPDTIQVPLDGVVTGQVKVTSPEGGSCLKAMSAKGPLPD